MSEEPPYGNRETTETMKGFLKEVYNLGPESPFDDLLDAMEGLMKIINCKHKFLWWSEEDGFKCVDCGKKINGEK